MTTWMDVADAALRETGRIDLADLIIGFEDDDGPYLEVQDELLDESDWAIMDKAEGLARSFIGLPPRTRDPSSWDWVPIDGRYLGNPPITGDPT